MSAMSCQICGREAIGRCYSCGALFCAEHGDTNCCRCDTSVMAGDPSPERITATSRQPTQHPGWWRPQAAEEYHPPACYQCQGIARQVCPNCQQRFCAEHAGKNGMCAQCHQSSFLGVVVLGTVGVAFAVVWLWSWLQR
jgi:hypothetical protein